jgi:putative endonuclease
VSVSRQALGRRGEELAARWYRTQGYEIVARNWRAGRDGELDLVARRGREVLVFCEVKTRSSTAFGVPAEAVGRAKQARIRRLAARFLADNGVRAREIRFDVACVLAGEISVIEAAF